MKKSTLHLLYGVICLSVVGLSGCQSWLAGGYPLQSPARVPPPGTGTYQVPSNYYNNMGAGGQAYQVPTQGGMMAGPQQYPAQGMNGGAVQAATYAAPVQPESGTAVQFSDSQPPNLDWQP